VVIPAQINNPMDFIDPDFHDLFLQAEKLALGDSRKFSSLVRCAAFCEMLYAEKKYMLAAKHNVVTMTSFAKQRYGMNIKGALHPSKSIARNNHKTRSVKDMPALKNCFN